MNKLRTILIGIIGVSISFYLQHKFLGVDFVFEHLYFMTGGIILAVLIHRCK